MQTQHPGGLKLSAASQRCDCSLLDSELLLIPWFLAAVCTSSMLLYSASENSTAVFNKKESDSYPVHCLAACAPLVQWNSFILLNIFWAQIPGSWNRLRPVISGHFLVVPFRWKRVPAYRKLLWKHAKSLSHKGSWERQNNLFQRYQIKTICSAFRPLLELEKKH